MTEIKDKNPTFNNVFDNEEEFKKFFDLIIEAIQKFAEYRNGNLTYGEVLFVLESVIEKIKRDSEAKAKVHKIEGLTEAPTFTGLMSIIARLIDTMENKGLINEDERNYIINGK